MALYFAVYAIFHIEASQEFIFVYLTGVGHLLLTVYLLYSSISVTARFVLFLSPCCKKESKNPAPIELPSKPTGCCGWMHNTLKWYDYVHWVLFTMSTELAFGIVILFWLLLYNLEYTVTHWDVAIHLLNGVFAFLEVWITRIPVRLYHILYLSIITAAYCAFTGIYFAAGGRSASNETYIYSIIDYANAPGTAAGTVLGVVFVFMPLVHSFFYVNYLLREGLIYALVKKAGCCKWLATFEKQDDTNKKEHSLANMS